MKQQTKLPDRWEEVKLKDLGKVSTGKTPSTSDKSYWDGEIPFITPSDFNQQGVIYSAERKISNEGIKQANGLLPKDAVLVVCIGSTIGKVGITGQACVTNQQINSIICHKNINPYLVYYQLLKNLSVFKSHSGVAAVPIINKSSFEKIRITIPTNPNEQTAIAKILSTTDEALEALERKRLATERLRRGFMVKLLDEKKWRLTNIQDIFHIETGTTPSTKDKTYWLNGTIDWITPADMNDLGDKLDLPESKRKITEKALKEINLTLMPIDSIVISTRAPVGYIGLAKKELTFNQGCKGLIPRDKSKTNTLFYAYYLASLKDYLNNISGGSTFKELSKDSLCKLELPIPPIEEQRHIAEMLSTIDKKLELQKFKKEKIERVKKGLMDELLTGKKRVNVGKVLEERK